MNFRETYNGFDILHDTTNERFIIALDTPDGSLPQNNGAELKSLEEAKSHIDQRRGR